MFGVEGLADADHELIALCEAVDVELEGRERQAVVRADAHDEAVEARDEVRVPERVADPAIVAGERDDEVVGEFGGVAFEGLKTTGKIGSFHTITDGGGKK